MAIRMRRGNEADFDPSKMLPGEWAVSTDTKYVRMCFSPGIVLRMATYEAFESDMAEMRKILSECQSIQTAVELIQKNVTNSELVIENYVKEAKQYRDEAEQFRNEASMFAPEGYEDLVKNVSDNTVKIDTIIEKAELNIKNNSRGSNIHLTDSADSNVVELELYGKTEQNAYTGKNKYKMRDSSGTTNTVVVEVNDDGTVNFSSTGAVTTSVSIVLMGNRDELVELLNTGGTFVMSLKNGVYNSSTFNVSISYKDSSDGTTKFIKPNEPVTIPSGSTFFDSVLYVASGVTIDNVTNFAIQLEKGDTVTDFEPYVGGKTSPSQSYPQEIKSVKGKNLLDCRGLTEHTTNGITFTPVYDENGNLLYINTNGTASADIQFNKIISGIPIAGKNTYLFNGVNGGSLDTYNMTIFDANWQSVTVSNGESVYWKYDTEIVRLRITILNGVTMNNIKFYPMIRLASIKDNTYVPYGLLRIKTHGKNLFYFPNVYYNGTGLTLAKNTDGTYSLNGNVTGNEIRFLGSYANTDKVITLKNGNYKCIATINDKVINSDVALTNGTTVKGYSGNNFAITDEWAISSLKVTVPSDVSSYSNAILKIMICEYNASDNFEPYQISEITLSEPIELNGFNGVYDVVTSDGVTRKFAEVVFDGSDDEGWNITSVSNGSLFYIKLNDAKSSKNILCTQATIYNCGISASLNFYIDVFSQYSSVAELKTHLAENPMTIVYELATPTTEALQSDFTALKTFYPETYVSNDADCDMSITYTADAKNYIDNKIALLTTAIYNNI